MKKGFILVCILLCSSIVLADSAWEELIRGNQRFVAGEQINKDFSSRRVELIAGQHPFAAIVACSDSRVPPELLMDQGLGDLFVVRTAGNVVGPIELGSLEYGVEHLHIPLIVVLGHQDCGAVAATVQGAAGGNVQNVVNEIMPAVKIARKHGANLLEYSIDENVKLVMKNIMKSPVIAEHVKEGKLAVVGAKYFFDTGRIELIGVAAVPEPASDLPVFAFVIVMGAVIYYFAVKRK